MTIDYELVALYGEDKVLENTAKKQLDSLLEDSYVEDHEIQEIAIACNVVILYEFTESTGYSEVLLIDNLGHHIDGTSFRIEDIEALRKEFKYKSILGTLDEIDKAMVLAHMESHGIKEREFIEEYLDEFYLDKYELKKESLKTTMKEFFKQ